MTYTSVFRPTNKILSDNWTQYDTRYTSCKTSSKVPADFFHRENITAGFTRCYGYQAIQPLMNNPDLVGSYDFLQDY